MVYYMERDYGGCQKMDVDRIRYYQTTEALKVEDFVSDCGDGILVKKCNMINEVPIGRVLGHPRGTEIVVGDRIGVKSIWEFDRLREKIIIDGDLYVIGTEYKFIDCMISGGSVEEYYRRCEEERKIGEKIQKLKIKRDNLWRFHG